MCRKNITRLTLAERTAFVNAVLQLKASGGYDKYIQVHASAGSHGHGGPAFLPWHREFLRRYELDLQAIDSSVHLPYWDWTVENLNSAGTESLVWANDFMGGPGNPAQNFRVTTGPFAAWNIRRNNFNRFQSPGGGGSITAIKAQLRYRDFLALEGPHGGAHVWVGGDMGSVPTAVRDPIFFMLHCNIDRLWAEWTRDHQGDAGWVQYEPTSGGQLGHNLNDTMWPWNGTNNPIAVAPWNAFPENVRPADRLDHRAINTFYDTVDPECRPKLKDRLPKEFKERLPKELIKDRLPKEFKERLPKELIKDRLPKEGGKDRLPKEFKERKEFGPKENKDIREIDRKRVFEVDPKISERVDPGVFIAPELRPDLGGAAFGFEDDVFDELDRLRARVEELGGEPG